MMHGTWRLSLVAQIQPDLNVVDFWISCEVGESPEDLDEVWSSGLEAAPLNEHRRARYVAVHKWMVAVLEASEPCPPATWELHTIVRETEPQG